MHLGLLIKKKLQRVDIFLDIGENIRENQERSEEYDKWIDNFKYFVKTKVFWGVSVCETLPEAKEN